MELLFERRILSFSTEKERQQYVLPEGFEILHSMEPETTDECYLTIVRGDPYVSILLIKEEPEVS